MEWNEFITGFAGASKLEWIGTVCGFLCVYLVIKRSVWCFFFGLIQVSIYSWIFFDVKLYSDMVLHLIYVGFQIYGFLVWSRSADQTGHIQVLAGSKLEYAGLIVLIAVSTLAVGWLMKNHTDASLPYFDVFTTSASLVAQWLLTFKKLMNWSFWIVVDIVAIGMYLHKGLFPTSLLYFCFLVMAFIGQWQWYKNWRLNEQNTKQQLKVG